MSAREIIEELPHLTPAELADIETRLREVQQRQRHGAAESQPPSDSRSVLLEYAGTFDGLPPDLAAEHDHYLHGTPKHGQ